MNDASERVLKASERSFSATCGERPFIFPVQLVGPSQEDLEWLRPLWILCGRKNEFEVRSKDLTFPGGYEALLEKLMDANKRSVLDYWPAFEGASENHVIKLAPGTVAALEENVKPTAKVRQVTVNGQRVDLRNRDTFILMNADIKEVENVAASYLHQLEDKPIKKVRRACICSLQRIMLLRGRQLRRDLYGSIALRLGYPLPPDFFNPNTPQESWYKLDPAPKRGLELLNLLRRLVPEPTLTGLLEEHAAYGHPENEVSELLALQKTNPDVCVHGLKT